MIDIEMSSNDSIIADDDDDIQTHESNHNKISKNVLEKTSSITKPFTSMVHQFFSIDKQAKKSTCNLCSVKLSGSNTTNLKNHLKAKHPTEYDANQGSIRKSSKASMMLDVPITIKGTLDY